MYQKFVAAVAALTLSVCTALAQGTATILDGVYTTQQAARGQDAYRDYCVSCHEGIDQEGPDLKGSAFVDRWREDELNVLFSKISTSMPGNRALFTPLPPRIDARPPANSIWPRGVANSSIV